MSVTGTGVAEVVDGNVLGLGVDALLAPDVFGACCCVGEAVCSLGSGALQASGIKKRVATMIERSSSAGTERFSCSRAANN
jgi:hypothetical protein